MALILGSFSLQNDEQTVATSWGWFAPTSYGLPSTVYCPRTSSIVCRKHFAQWVCLIWWPSTQFARSAKEVVCFVFFLNVWRTIYGNFSKMICTQRYCKYVCIQNLWKDSNSSRCYDVIMFHIVIILCHEQNCRSQRKTCHFTLNCTDSGVELAAYILYHVVNMYIIYTCFLSQCCIIGYTLTLSPCPFDFFHGVHAHQSCTLRNRTYQDIRSADAKFSCSRQPLSVNETNQLFILNGG